MQPVINKTSKSFTTRDSLGIEGVATTISREISPIVNTVTPRPFYWAFIAWCYYDWYQNNECQRKRTEVNKYIKKVNYFIALGNILANGYQENSYTGSSNINNSIDITTKSFLYNDSYLTGIGAMGYYPPGLEQMEMVVNVNTNTGEVYKEPQIRQNDGVVLAEAFDTVISKTRYYKEYRFSQKPVPRDVLIELGSIIHINLDGFDECKKILKKNLFETKARFKLNQCKELINYTIDKYKIHANTDANCRQILYDIYSPRGLNNTVPDSLLSISREWEIVVGRMYFSTALEIMWKCMTNNLFGLYSIQEWIDKCIKESEFSFDIDSNLLSIVSGQHFDYNSREAIINEERLNRQFSKHSVNNSLILLLSIYNRFIGREDIDQKYYFYGENRESISLNQFFDLVETYKEKSIRDFVAYVMEKYLIKQHLNTAFSKMLDGRDGYYIEEIDGRYFLKHDFDFDFQGIRMVQLYSVMADLGILHE